MGYKVNIILIYILTLSSKISFGLIQEDSIHQINYGQIEVQESKILFNPKIEDHLKVVAYIWKEDCDGAYVPKIGTFKVVQIEDCISKYVYVNSSGRMYLIKIYRYTIENKMLDVFFQDKSLQIFYCKSFEKGIHEFFENCLKHVKRTQPISFSPQDAILNINQNVDISHLIKTLYYTFRSLLPVQLTINRSLIGTCDHSLKTMMSTIVLENLEFNLDTALFITGFKNLQNLQIIRCTTRSSDAFVAILYLVKKLLSLSLSGSTEVPEIFLKTIVSILKNKKFEFIPHDESEFLKYVTDNHDFELFEKIAFQLGTDNAKEFLIDTMINESNLNLDHLEKAIIIAKKTGSSLLINKAVISFFEIVWKYYYPVTFIVNKILNLLNNYRDCLSNVENISNYLSYCYYEILIIDVELARRQVEFMAMSDWNTIGQGSYLLYIIDNRAGNKESAMKNLMDACDRNNILALYAYAKMFTDDGLLEKPASEEKYAICKRIKDNLCTESVILICLSYEQHEIIEYIKKYSEIIDNYLVSRNLKSLDYDSEM